MDALLYLYVDSPAQIHLPQSSTQALHDSYGNTSMNQ